jgi:hypothetical protein
VITAASKNHLPLSNYCRRRVMTVIVVVVIVIVITITGINDNSIVLQFAGIQ